MADLGSARHWARALQAQAVFDGAVCVDATAGNGADTLFLAEGAGSAGRVYAFDVQAAALDRTREKLESAGILARVTLICAGHERMDEFVKGPADLIVFNLGWLPGGDKSVTTRTETTVEALNRALSLLKTGGLLTVCVYPGHEEGVRELEAVGRWARELSGRTYQALRCGYENQPSSAPVLFAVSRLG